ncbi:PREDICTED: microprocessor complex subunit DGCR8-like [Priapulus caudatus]|uniref:Microprocessor complex subunit DGCR8-like n=1 Tax=Priapulus caudatus TaxID=37621 RepID=A0ABM1E4T8_PRICU|nr:PREDICTED: microprocessor complex subunit DGCR8-like [Priapulus caudatus]XP_014667208.1 PREDICTED: microprocessor complex subunit DGCR8-like [Priapulus caudatus]XP_014667209.1 PREDICTED: microprocessor complex subunit DGCR8-like [Priapulus caudatus]XP_014667210.1 PREDICTED: microprocessor complex subunit DGCR8-like [Priapulus caudatus]
MESSDSLPSGPPPLPPEEDCQVPPAPPSPPLPEQMSSDSCRPLDFDEGSADGEPGGIDGPPAKRVRVGDQDFFSKKADNFELHILDEADDDDDDDDLSTGELDDGSVTDGDSLDEDEIEAMLDAGMEGYEKSRSKDGGVPDHEQREKIVLKPRGQDPFNVLPEGWVEVTHNSGMPIYLHKVSRVCSVSRPYFLGPGSARKHDLPITSIPCLYYRRELEREKAVQKTESTGQQPENAENGVPQNSAPPGDEIAKLASQVKLQSAEELSIDPLVFREYCMRLFEFQNITVRRFKNWADKRKHRKILKQQSRPTLPADLKLIRCPLPADRTDMSKALRKDCVLINPTGKSTVCILHEYVQQAMRTHPKYTYKEIENSKTPFSAMVQIDDVNYGTGFGSSKKTAKIDAARVTLEILIPDMKELFIEEGNSGANSYPTKADLSYFDEVRVVDPRVNELCTKAGQVGPYLILLECLKRNNGMGDTAIACEVTNNQHQKNEFTMTVGKHSAKVTCKNKREGKQRAAQAILQKMHPLISNWGSLLRLYGKGSCKTLKEKKQKEQTITELQKANKPNMAILSKLQMEMRQLATQKEAMQTKGRFEPGDIVLPSASATLNTIDL